MIKCAFPIFFNGFYKRQGDITKCVYNDLIFTGMGFSYNSFKELYDIFNNNNCVHVDNLKFVDTTLNFINEPLFTNFKSHVLHNFNLEYPIDKGHITFILRRGKREIKNIDFVKAHLSGVDYIYLEDYTIREQLNIISKTNVMIGVHGAGLTWAIFMKNGAKLIELNPGTSHTDNYIKWCKIANIHYTPLAVDIHEGNSYHFRDTTVTLNESQITSLKNIISLSS